MTKCQKCSKIATLHITDIFSEEHVEERHLCEECAQNYLHEPQQTVQSKLAELTGSEEELRASLAEHKCDECGLSFLEFRSTGRLGCSHDYDVFHDELVPLLENIHGETKHQGKVPRRLPQAQRRSSELAGLHKQLEQAVQAENYEKAAELRDRIQQLTES